MIIISKVSQMSQRRERIMSLAPWGDGYVGSRKEDGSLLHWRGHRRKARETNGARPPMGPVVSEHLNVLF